MNWELIVVLIFVATLVVYVLKHLREAIKWLKKEFDDW